MQSFSEALLRWYAHWGRKDLPWQKNITPYRVWVSEIMLQQTQVSTVLRYYDTFLQRFPNLQTLAVASLEEVLTLWAGLGYYARAKNLHKTAQIIAAEYKGIFPTDFDTVLSFPGIGRSTAGAILAISAKQRHPILDGNVKRVLSRYFAVSGATNHPKMLEKLWSFSEAVTPKKNIAAYTQAIMDLGATLCTRTKPNCSACPVKTHCKAHTLNKVANFPEKIIKNAIPTRTITVLMLIHQKQNAILLEKRETRGIWGGLWSLPECVQKTKIKKFCQDVFGLETINLKSLAPVRHTFTHFHLNIHPVLGELKTTKLKKFALPYQWHPLSQKNQLALAAPIKRLLQTIS
jgi:A/G-specific adenine glycosylase